VITFFTTAKPFIGVTKIAQINALGSWKRIHPEAEVILFGKSEGADQVAKDLGLVYIPDIQTNEYGTPLISAMFKEVQENGRFDLQAYLNADIILLDDFLPSVKRVALDQFLLAGQRWDLNFDEPLDFDTDWIGYVRWVIRQRGILHPPAGSDYFVYPRGLWHEIPPFAVGRVGWDNWVFYHCLVNRVAVIDASQVITVVHQNHEAYTHSKREGGLGRWRGPETDRNTELAGVGHKITLFYANMVLTPRSLRAKRGLRYRVETIIILPSLYPRFRWLSPFTWALSQFTWIVDERVPLYVVIRKLIRLIRRKPVSRAGP
jgi:hypothetical protein